MSRYAIVAAAVTFAAFSVDHAVAQRGEGRRPHLRYFSRNPDHHRIAENSILRVRAGADRPAAGL